MEVDGQRHSPVVFPPRGGHAVPEGHYIYSPTLSLTSALDGSGWSKTLPGGFSSRRRLGNHWNGEWVEFSARLGVYRRSCPHRNSISGPSSPQRNRYSDYATSSHDVRLMSYVIYNVFWIRTACVTKLVSLILINSHAVSRVSALAVHILAGFV